MLMLTIGNLQEVYEQHIQLTIAKPKGSGDICQSDCGVRLDKEPERTFHKCR